MRAAAVVVAGGAGTRLGGPVRKQYLEVGGEPVLLRAIRPFLHHPRITSIVVVLPTDDVADPPRWLAGLPIHTVAGGAERGDSVLNGLLALAEDVSHVLIHDGARPFVSTDIIDRVLDGCAEGGAIAAVPVTDTIQQVDAGGVITATPDRAALWQAQTPQGFPRAALLDAYHRARADGVAATDDAGLYARYVGPVRVVMGAYDNLKVTRQEDLPIAEAIANGLTQSQQG
ncbi:MAG TPA: 2-C-methyl-D-erythritol 4-phosphate cytidylyltransferase [Longimicrobium sp.]|uniref:2-C-methyl-D-erythritol 4-phosphate cytidylyltransferase n=1 Tax=Longimicrobium sp. TaxID=2029185 RepID=UPI002ED88BCA